MFKCVLKSLSDTELVSVASEVINPEILTESIVAQLDSKSNSPIFLSDKSIDEIGQILTSEIITELSSRLLESDKLIDQNDK